MRRGREIKNDTIRDKKRRYMFKGDIRREREREVGKQVKREK